MIYGLVQTIQEDTSFLSNWMIGVGIPDVNSDDQQHRIQVAALRMIAVMTMTLGVLWTVSILIFAVTVPLKLALRLAIAVGIYAMAHDVFIMSHNYAQPGFRVGYSARLFNVFRGQEVIQEERARQFTHGTLLQPLWMWIYAKRNEVV